MAVNTHGGGANTNAHGLKFEQDTSLNATLSKAGYLVVGCKVYCQGAPCALSVPKNLLYTHFLIPRGVDWRERISKKLLPDEALYVDRVKTLFIIEKKFQHSSGSVDEKLQTCAFKKRQYQRLVQGLDIDVEYLYVCNDWFQREEYRDVRAYIEAVGCHIFFQEIPLAVLRLPSCG